MLRLCSAAALLLMAGTVARADATSLGRADPARAERSWQLVVRTKTVLASSLDGGTRRRVRLDHGFVVLTRLNDDSLTSRRPECQAALLERRSGAQAVASGGWIAIPIVGSLLDQEDADRACKKPEWLPPRPERLEPEPVGSLVVGERGPGALVLVGSLYEEVFFVTGLSSAEQTRAAQLGYASLNVDVDEDD